jgi:hypothetical protein
MMILRTSVTGDAQSNWASEAVLEIEQGSLYLALHRLEDRGWCPHTGDRVRTIAKRSFTGLARVGKKAIGPGDEPMATDDSCYWPGLG